MHLWAPAGMRRWTPPCWRHSGGSRCFPAPALLKLVQSKFLSGESGEKARLDLARVEEWLANAEIRGLVRVDSRNRYRLTQAGERRRRADQLGGLTVLRNPRRHEVFVAGGRYSSSPPRVAAARFTQFSKPTGSSL